MASESCDEVSWAAHLVGLGQLCRAKYPKRSRYSSIMELGLNIYVWCGLWNRLHTGSITGPSGCWVAWLGSRCRLRVKAVCLLGAGFRLQGWVYSVVYLYERHVSYRQLGLHKGMILGPLHKFPTQDSSHLWLTRNVDRSSCRFYFVAFGVS